MQNSWLAFVGPSGRHLPIALTLAIGILIGAPPDARSQIVPAAPVRETVDANGVDLFSGRLTVAGPTLVLGSEGNALSYYRWNKGSGWTDNTMAFMNLSGSVMTLNLGGVSDSFTVSGTTYTSTEGNGSTLTYNSTSKIYTYIRGDGTVARFDKNALSEYVPYSNNGMILDIVSPASEKLTFAHDFITYCKVPGASGQFCAQTAKAYRVSSVTSSYGYRLVPSYEYYEWTYDPTDPYAQPNFTIWAAVTGVSGRNLAVSTSTSIASQTFGYVTSGGITTYNITDAEGRQAKYRVGAGGLVAGITFPSHTAEDISFVYSGVVVSSITRAGAGTTTYGRTDTGNLRTVTVTPPSVIPAMTATVYKFDILKQRMTSVTVTENGTARITNFEYDSSGRLTKTTLPEGNYVNLTRDGRGNITETRVVGKLGSGSTDIVSTAGFDANCTFPVKCNQPNWTRDAKNNQTDYTYDSAHGGVLTATAPSDASGIRPEMRYGYTSMQAYYYIGASIVASGQPVYRLASTSSCRTTASCTGTTDERKTTIYYGPQTINVGNNLHRLGITTSLGDGTIAGTLSVSYDSIGNAISIDGPLPGSADQSVMGYNAVRQPSWQIGPDPDIGGAALFPAIKYTYRLDGQIDFVQSGTVTAQSQSGISSLTELQRQTAGYDGYYRPIRNALISATTSYQISDVIYDAAGRVQCSMLRMDPGNWNTPAASCNPTQTSSPNGPDRVSYNSYDAFSRVWKLTTAYGTSAPVDERIATFTANGRLETLKDAENNRTTYEYDVHDRLVKTRFPDTAKGADQSSSSDYEQITYDSNGNVATFRTRRNETIELTYDNLNRLITKVVPQRSLLDSTHTRDSYFRYDLFGDMSDARFDSATGPGIANTFNALGQLTGTITNTDGVSRTLSYLYDIAGNPTRITHPDGTYFTYARNAAGGLDQINLNATTALLKPILDAQGRLTRLDRWRTSPGDWLARTTVGYDSVSRIASLVTDLNGTSSDATTDFTYNPAGQIATTTRTNDIYAWNAQVNANLTYSPDGLNRYGGAGFGYDANGNLTSDSANTFVYDVENRLVTRSGGASATLHYDPLGRLYEVVGASATRRFLYDGSDLIAEYNVSGVMQRRYVHGLGPGDDPLVLFVGSGVASSDRRNLYADERGSIVAVTDSVGAVTSRNTFDEYGVPGTGNSTVAFQYTGQVWLPELGMYYYKARMYSPILGRFMQTDPIGYGDGMNMYSYVHNSPINLLDPTGLDTCVNVTINILPPLPSATAPRMNSYLPEVVVSATRQQPTVNVCFGDRPAVEPGGNRDEGKQGDGSSPSPLADPRDPDAPCDSQESSTIDYMKSCAAGSATACGQLDAANLADLTAALSSLASVTPEIFDRIGPDLPTFTFDRSVDFWKSNQGATGKWFGNITLASGYRDLNYFYEVVGHELMHSGDSPFVRMFGGAKRHEEIQSSEPNFSAGCRAP